VLAGTAPRLAIAFAPFASRVREALDSAGLDDVVLAAVGGEAADATPLETLLTLEGDPYAEPALGADDLAAVPFSSGTGGLPKGVRLTHGNLAAAAEQAISAFRSGGAYDERSVVLAGAPFFHSIGLSLMLCAPLRLGATIVTFPLPQLEPLLDLIAAHRVTHVAVPPQLIDELATDPRVAERDLSSLLLVTTGGAHVPAQAEHSLSERLGCVARQGYGMTECTCTISAPLIRPSTPGTVGWLVPGTEARLIDPDTGADAERGEPGELWVRGPQTMAGYLRRPDATAAMIDADGWLRTGDLVVIDEEGQRFVVDRLKELIKVNASQVAPAELGGRARPASAGHRRRRHRTPPCGHRRGAGRGGRGPRAARRPRAQGVGDGARRALQAHPRGALRRRDPPYVGGQDPAPRTGRARAPGGVNYSSSRQTGRWQ
jgi:acyl-CoA synthetase (AMP-forming)/AMP-acid ligase II